MIAWSFARLRNARGTQLIQHLLDSDLTDLLIDAEAAAKFSVGSSSVDPLIRVELPPQLAGPIEPVSAELVFELRPRPGAGLRVALRMHEDRFRELMIPGQPPDIVSCLTENGPVRLQRDLSRRASQGRRGDRAIFAESFERRWFAPLGCRNRRDRSGPARLVVQRRRSDAANHLA